MNYEVWESFGHEHQSSHIRISHVPDAILYNTSTRLLLQSKAITITTTDYQLNVNCFLLFLTSFIVFMQMAQQSTAQRTGRENNNRGKSHPDLFNYRFFMLSLCFGGWGKMCNLYGRRMGDWTSQPRERMGENKCCLQNGVGRSKEYLTKISFMK